MMFVMLYACFFGLGFVAGCAFKGGGYWIGRMHEYDFCKRQGWFGPVIRATNARPTHFDEGLPAMCMT